MINNYKDLKEIIRNKSSDLIPLVLLVNVVVLNLRVELNSIIMHIAFSILLVFSYILVFIIIANFVDKQFQDIREIGGTNEVWEHKKNFFKKTKLEIIEKRKFRLIDYGVCGLFIIDLISIIYYRNSVIIEIFAFLIRYIFRQAQNAG